MCLESSWGRLGWFWWRLGAIGRSLGDVLGALGGVLGALLDVLEVSWRALWAMICQDLDRNPRNTNTQKKTRKNMVFWRCRSSSGDLGDVLGASWAILSALWKPLADASGAPVGHLRSSRGIEKGQDGARRSTVHFGCQLGFNLDYLLGRSKRAERRHAVPSRPRRCDRIAIKREIRENRESGREEDHMF